MSDHNSHIQVNITLAPVPPAAAGFGRVLFMRNNITLGGARTKLYTTIEEAAVDLAAGDIDAATEAAIITAFSQIPRPADFLVGRVDLTGGETYATAFPLIETDNPNFYGTTIDSRLAASADPLSVLIEAASTKRQLFLQSADADWLTSGLPAAYAFFGSKERTSLIYHDDTSEWADVAWAVSRLVHDPDVTSAAWIGELKNVAAIDPLPTSSEVAFIDGNNANVGLEFGSAPVFVYEGINGNGRDIDHVLSGDWFSARLSERTQALVQDYAQRGIKLPITTIGQSIITSLIEAQLAQGVTAGHFAANQTRVTAEDITTADILAKQLRFTVEAQLVSNANNIIFNVNFSTTPLSE